MGYKRVPKQYKLIFDDEEMEGFEVTMRSLTIERFLELTSLVDQFGVEDKDSTSAEAINGINRLFMVFSESLVSWNLEDEKDEPVPTTLEAVEQQELSFIFQIVTNWIAAMSMVAPPLPNGSKPGVNTEALASLPMEMTSPSPPS